ncbi:MAG: hypothetical protein JNM28_10500 [Armatimonadetes bacterium]|nr:hypothetical protein [Armatimonadota bacterium]
MNKLWLAFPAVGLVAFLASGYLFAPSDQQMIDKALKESTDAAAKGEPSDVLKYLSRSFTYGGEAANTFDISKVIHQARPKIAILETRASIHGEDAEVVTPVDVQLDYMGFAINKTIPNVSITLKKESSFKWGIVPEPRWRITGVTAEQLPDY